MKIFEHKIIDSTQKEAKRLIDKGIIQKINQKSVNQSYLITSKSQTNGKGKHGRIWRSDFGNLYATFVLNNNNNIHFELMFDVAKIVKEALQDFIFKNNTKNITENTLNIDTISVKFPNDIMINDQKVAGVLIEVYKPFLLIGIGINIANNPHNIDQQTTCLANYNNNTALNTTLNSDLIIKELLSVIIKDIENAFYANLT